MPESAGHPFREPFLSRRLASPGSERRVCDGRRIGGCRSNAAKRPRDQRDRGEPDRRHQDCNIGEEGDGCDGYPAPRRALRRRCRNISDTGRSLRPRKARSRQWFRGGSCRRYAPWTRGLLGH